MKHWMQTYGGHYRALVRLGFPIVVGQLGVIILGFADTLMIGHHSTEELGGGFVREQSFQLMHHFQYRFQLRTNACGGCALR